MFHIKKKIGLVWNYNLGVIYTQGLHIKMLYVYFLLSCRPVACFT